MDVMKCQGVPELSYEMAAAEAKQFIAPVSQQGINSVYISRTSGNNLTAAPLPYQNQVSSWLIMLLLYWTSNLTGGL